jgi:hypothetical protein
MITWLYRPIHEDLDRTDSPRWHFSNVLFSPKQAARERKGNPKLRRRYAVIAPVGSLVLHAEDLSLPVPAAVCEELGLTVSRPPRWWLGMAERLVFLLPCWEGEQDSPIIRVPRPQGIGFFTEVHVWPETLIAYRDGLPHLKHKTYDPLRFKLPLARECTPLDLLLAHPQKGETLRPAFTLFYDVACNLIYRREHLSLGWAWLNPIQARLSSKSRGRGQDHPPNQ